MINLPIRWTLKVSPTMNTIMINGLIKSSIRNSEQYLILGALDVISLSKKHRGKLFYEKGLYTGRPYNSFHGITFYLKFESPGKLDLFIKTFINEIKKCT